MRRCPACGRTWTDGQSFCPDDGTALEVEREVSLVGTIIAKRYRVMRLLGAGGMGKVYLVHHLNLDAPLAIKVISPSQAKDPDAVERLRREARNAHKARHPNVVQVHDLEEDGAHVFLTMDFVDGPTLDQVVATEGRLPLQRVLSLIRGVAEGLGAIHGWRMVHRDLKPSNVIVDRSEDGREVPKLLDFGISRVEHDPAQALTSPEFVFGTPGFMAPEHRMGLPVDARADVFALAILTLYLLAGRLPRLAAGRDSRSSSSSATWSRRPRCDQYLSGPWRGVRRPGTGAPWTSHTPWTRRLVWLGRGHSRRTRRACPRSRPLLRRRASGRRDCCVRPRRCRCAPWRKLQPACRQEPSPQANRQLRGPGVAGGACWPWWPEGSRQLSRCPLSCACHAGPLERRTRHQPWGRAYRRWFCALNPIPRSQKPVRHPSRRANR
ncbi:MAG: serine/threonine protein kinase [Gemmatimonadetes bacterium]|nr:serine/threonine protein kinase [Gemmatimonadota bacterium]